MTQCFHLHRPSGLSLTFMDVGATWLSCQVPVPGEATPREVLLAHPRPEDHPDSPTYFGATVGRYANRIAQARLHRPPAPDMRLAPHPAGSPHQLHGGPDGFNRRRWQVLDHSPTSVGFALFSPDGDQGFPGNLQVTVRYTLLDDWTLEMTITGTVDQACPVALTQHAYFNLDGTPGATVLDHSLQVRASHYLPVDADLLPVDGPAPVQSTGFDFRQPKRIGQDLMRDAQQALTGGYDHGWLLDPAALAVPAARLCSQDERVSLELHTTLPALQVYTGNFLTGAIGREGQALPRHAGVALEPGWLADSPHHPEWPQASCWLSPGETFAYTLQWRWSAK